MTIEVGGMIGAGVAAFIAGLALVVPRLRAACGPGKIIVLGPVFEAVALAIFSAEHFTAARDLAPIVPRWLPGPLFWTYFFGAALLAAAISFIVWRYVRWSALLLALFFLLVVVTVSLPNLPANAHNRFSWILTVRETAFGCGALVLAGSLWPRGSRTCAALMGVGRTVVALILIFYASQHFLYPRFVPGVPLEKPTPEWMPAPVLIAWFTGVVLLLGGVGLLIRSTTRIASAACGLWLLILTVAFYVPILCVEFGTPLTVEGINYVGDTMLFAATVLLAGFAADQPAV